MCIWAERTSDSGMYRSFADLVVCMVFLLTSDGNNHTNKNNNKSTGTILLEKIIHFIITIII